MISDMRRPVAAAGSAVFLLAAPGTAAGLVPWLLTGWQAGHWWPPVRIASAIIGSGLIAAGSATLLHAFAKFVLEGRGTPVPVAPPEQLVVTGVYGHVRNPMYLAVLAVIGGQGLLLARPVLLGYGLAVTASFWTFVHWYEEPTLTRKFGDQFDQYRRSVPGWWPRLTGWP